MFQNRVLNRICGPTRGNVTGECKKKLHNEELNDLYSSANFILVIKSRRLRKVGHVIRTVGRRGVYRGLVGKSEGKRPLGRPRRRWKDIKMDLQELGWGSMDWIDLAQNRDRWKDLANAVINLRFHKMRGIS
jgi:hypothetical protein